MNKNLLNLLFSTIVVIWWRWWNVNWYVDWCWLWWMRVREVSTSSVIIVFVTIPSFMFMASTSFVAAPSFVTTGKCNINKCPKDYQQHRYSDNWFGEQHYYLFNLFQINVLKLLKFYTKHIVSMKNSPKCILYLINNLKALL